MDDAHEFIAWALHRYDMGTAEPFGIVLRETGRVIGTCGLSPTWAHQRGEIGYALARAHWAQGLTTEAVRRKSPDIELGSHFSHFCAALGIPPTTKKGRSGSG